MKRRDEIINKKNCKYDNWKIQSYTYKYQQKEEKTHYGVE